jgi:hypothetical protein
MKNALNSTAVREQVIETARGTTVFHTSPDRIGNVWLALPPITEQRQITTYISHRDTLLVDAIGERPCFRAGYCSFYLLP